MAWPSSRSKVTTQIAWTQLLKLSQGKRGTSFSSVGAMVRVPHEPQWPASLPPARCQTLDWRLHSTTTVPFIPAPRDFFPIIPNVFVSQRPVWKERSGWCHYKPSEGVQIRGLRGGGSVKRYKVIQVISREHWPSITLVWRGYGRKFIAPASTVNKVKFTEKKKHRVGVVGFIYTGLVDKNGWPGGRGC